MDKLSALIRELFPAPEDRMRYHDEPPMASPDPWKHRSVGMRCRTCMFYVPKVVAGQEVALLYHRIGRCRRHAPTMNGYPVVFADDWCGDHKLDETKV